MLEALLQRSGTPVPVRLGGSSGFRVDEGGGGRGVRGGTATLGAMHDKEPYARILNIEDPWRVAEVELNEQPARRYDTRRRRWRHLDTCEFRTILVAQMPRVLYERHKVKQVGAPWAENRSRFTMRFEAQVIDWLQEATTAAAASIPLSP